MGNFLFVFNIVGFDFFINYLEGLFILNVFIGIYVLNENVGNWIINIYENLFFYSLNKIVYIGISFELGS